VKKKVAITTDSVCAYPELVKRFNIGIIPYYVVLDGKDYSDLEMSIEELYNKCKFTERKNLPTTAAPSAEEMLQVWQELSQNAEAIVHFTITSAYSGAYNVALQAKNLAREKMLKTTIEIFDSKTVSCGQFPIVLEAAKAAAQGKKLEEVTKIAQDIMSRVTLLMARDTLFYFDKAGITHEAHSWAEAESVSNFKSLLEVDASTEGRSKPLARTKTRNEMMGKMIDIAKERTKNKKLHLLIDHYRLPNQAEQLKKMVLSQFECEELYIREGTAVGLATNGPGLLELAFYTSD
jgi:DegV family protein with EDD domain